MTAEEASRLVPGDRILVNCHSCDGKPRVSYGIVTSGPHTHSDDSTIEVAIFPSETESPHHIPIVIFPRIGQLTRKKVAGLTT